VVEFCSINRMIKASLLLGNIVTRAGIADLEGSTIQELRGEGMIEDLIGTGTLEIVEPHNMRPAMAAIEMKGITVTTGNSETALVVGIVEAGTTTLEGGLRRVTMIIGAGITEAISVTMITEIIAVTSALTRAIPEATLVSMICVVVNEVALDKGMGSTRMRISEEILGGITEETNTGAVIDSQFIIFSLDAWFIFGVG
jgi:hypothetical protein